MKKHVLDTSLIGVIIDGEKHPDYERLAGRLDSVPGGPVVTISSFEESMKGWLAYCAKAKTPEQYIAATRKLHKALDFFTVIEILDFDAPAAVEFKKLKAAKLKVGTMDLRIASVVLAVGGKLLSANLTDFRKVPGLDVEDWSSP
jgi:tRNA(fMet)-specific endonuclease VapC